jgi:hypothetical protein
VENDLPSVRCDRGWLGSRYLNLTTLNPLGRKVDVRRSREQQAMEA